MTKVALKSVRGVISFQMFDLALKMSGWVTALEAANMNCSATCSTRTTQLYAADTPDTIRGKRTEAINAWYELARKTDANRELAASTTD